MRLIDHERDGARADLACPGGSAGGGAGVWACETPSAARFALGPVVDDAAARPAFAELDLGARRNERARRDRAAAEARAVGRAQVVHEQRVALAGAARRGATTRRDRSRDRRRRRSTDGDRNAERRDRRTRAAVLPARPRRSPPRPSPVGVLGGGGTAEAWLDGTPKLASQIFAALNLDLARAFGRALPAQGQRVVARAQPHLHARRRCRRRPGGGANAGVVPVGEHAQPGRARST